jgi:hypothetical protein
MKTIHNRREMEKVYVQNDCPDCHLRSTEDLKNIHEVDYASVKGYDTLTKENKALFQAFIVNYWNAYGLDTRMTMSPICIYFVEDQEFNCYYNDSDGEKMCATAKRVIKAVTASETKKTLHKYVDLKYIDEKPLEPSAVKRYLRFEYKTNGSKEWMHVESDKQWY